MTIYFNLLDRPDAGPDRPAQTAAQLAPVTMEVPPAPETPPSPWLALADTSSINMLDFDTVNGREAYAALMAETPLYRITAELLVDQILFDSMKDAARMKGVRAAFAPEDAPEPIIETIAKKYEFAGTLRFPVIATRTDVQLLELYLKLYGPACPQHGSIETHLMALMGGNTQRLLEKCDGMSWRARGWVRLDKIVYDAERLDHDPDVTFESYVTRGRAAAEALAVSEPEPLLAAWIQAERVQRELCRDIDAVLRLGDIRRLPRWVRADVFRILEREAMKQVFAEGITKQYAEWPALRRCTHLSEPISANAKGEVAPLIQQLLNQTLSADARYAGSAEAFAVQAERRMREAKRLIGKNG
ncbi:MAG: hypothetical protein KGQ41_03580 [Alphaproteobacteria bacterium]|nr:hypothetical protein [Alphaproteobacteria bacterium]